MPTVTTAVPVAPETAAPDFSEKQPDEACPISPADVLLSTTTVTERCVKSLLINIRPVYNFKNGVVVVFLRGNEWAFSAVGRETYAALPGRHYFDLDHGEHINEVRYKQDRQRLHAVQFITSSGRASPLYTSMWAEDAVPTHRYVAPLDRGEIVGLVRARSSVIIGTIILGVVHVSLAGNGNSVLLFNIPERDKRSCLALTCFCLNVLCCAQTCTGQRVTAATPCCGPSEQNKGALACFLGALGYLVWLPRGILAIPAVCCMTVCGRCCLSSPPFIITQCCGLSDRYVHRYFCNSFIL